MNLFLRSLIAAGVKTGLGLYLTQTIRNILYASAHNKPCDIRDMHCSVRQRTEQCMGGLLPCGIATQFIFGLCPTTLSTQS